MPTWIRSTTSSAPIWTSPVVMERRVPRRRPSVRAWDAIFRDGVLEHSLKELCRVYVSKTIECNY